MKDNIRHNITAPEGYFRACEYIKYLKNKARRLLGSISSNCSCRVLLQGTGFLAEIVTPVIVEVRGEIYAIWDNGIPRSWLWSEKKIYKNSELRSIKDLVDIVFLTSIHAEGELRQKAKEVFKNAKVIIGPSDLFKQDIEPKNIMEDRNCTVFSNYNDIKKHFPDHLPRYQLAVSFIKKEDVILDFACGCGYGTALLGKAGARCVGGDVLQELIEYARIHWNGHNTSYKVVDAEKLKECFDKELFSFICCLETIEHLKRPIVFISELVGLLKYGGRILISTPQPPQGNPHHIHEFDLKDLVMLLKNAGLVIDKSFIQVSPDVIVEGNDPMPGRQYLLLACKNA